MPCFDFVGRTQVSSIPAQTLADLNLSPTISNTPPLPRPIPDGLTSSDAGPSGAPRNGSQPVRDEYGGAGGAGAFVKPEAEGGGAAGPPADAEAAAALVRSVDDAVAKIPKAMWDKLYGYQKVRAVEKPARAATS